MDSKKEESQKANDTTIPGIDKIKDEYRSQIRTIKDKMKDLERA